MLFFRLSPTAPVPSSKVGWSGNRSEPVVVEKQSASQKAVAKIRLRQTCVFEHLDRIFYLFVSRAWLNLLKTVKVSQSSSRISFEHRHNTVIAETKSRGLSHRARNVSAHIPTCNMVADACTHTPHPHVCCTGEIEKFVKLLYMCSYFLCLYGLYPLRQLEGQECILCFSGPRKLFSDSM